MIKNQKSGTDIYSPLKNIYNSKKDYDNIKLPKNIFLLTDGAVDNKKDTLNIIEENNNEFFVYSIGIGNYFDKDLIKNAGLLGKGNYDFCNDIKDLNETIVNGIKNCSNPFIHDFEFNCNLNGKNIYEFNNNKISILKENQMVNIPYIIKNDNELDKKIKLDIKYFIYDKKEKNNKEVNENYEIELEEIQTGEELSKLIINDNIVENKKLNEEEKTKLALKYQILTDYTSLFAEVELSEKITEEMKKEIIGDEDNNIIKKIRNLRTRKYANYYDDDEDEGDLGDEYCDDDVEEVGNAFGSILLNIKSANQNLMRMNKELCSQGEAIDYPERKITCANNSSDDYKSSSKKSSGNAVAGFFKSIGNSIKGIFTKKKEGSDSKTKEDIKNTKKDEIKNEIKDEIKNEIKDEIKNEIKNEKKDEIKNEKKDEIKKENKDEIKNEKKDENKNEKKEEIKNDKKDEIKNENKDEIKNEKKDEIKNEKKDEIKNENKQLNIKDLINEQNFVEGYWEINGNSTKVKEKYENEFKLLKEIKDKNINDNIAITILIIYFINKEHPELLNELFMIIEKAKNYIKNNTKDSYENIIKEIGI